jgi:hypothetical protein
MQFRARFVHIRCIWAENDDIAAEAWCLQSACSRRGLPDALPISETSVAAASWAL